MELKIENLEVTLQKNKILNRVSLTVKSGELISLTGSFRLWKKYNVEKHSRITRY